MPHRLVVFMVPVLAVILAPNQGLAQPHVAAHRAQPAWARMQVLINNHVLSRDVVVSPMAGGDPTAGVFVPLADFAQVVNGSTLLEPALALKGSTLSLALTSPASGAILQKAIGDKKEKEVMAKRQTQPGLSGVKYEDIAEAKMTIKFAPELKRDVLLKGASAPSPDVRVQRVEIVKKIGPAPQPPVYAPGVISNDVRMFGRKAALPLADVARAFGGTVHFANGAYEITVPQ
ncbi:MAG: hypothetical protein PVSMB1_11670 [Gemmatimonadaceae bacterium]